MLQAHSVHTERYRRLNITCPCVCETHRQGSHNTSCQPRVRQFALDRGSQPVVYCAMNTTKYNLLRHPMTHLSGGCGIDSTRSVCCIRLEKEEFRLTDSRWKDLAHEALGTGECDVETISDPAVVP